MIRSNSSFSLHPDSYRDIKKAKFLMFQKELPLVAFLKQETFAFFTPGFSLQSGLGIIITINIFVINFLCNFNNLNFSNTQIKAEHTSANKKSVFIRVFTK